MKNSIVSLASALLLFATAGSARADVVTESLHVNGSTLSKYRGQSFTTGPAAEYVGLSFNLYRFAPGLAAYAPADHTFFLLGKEYLWRNDGLNTSTAGFIAKTTGVRGDQWVFDQSVTLLGNTQYWLYGSGDSNTSTVTFPVGSNYSGGQGYASNAGPGNTFMADSRFDMAFTINCNPVPDPRALALATQSNPVIDSGPLSLGLSELPVDPCPRFTLRDGTPLAGGSIGYRLADVISAELIFGDFSGTNLKEFYLEVAGNGEISALSYTFAASDTPTAAGIVGMNGFISTNGFIGMEGVSVTEMPFSVTGTDILSGQAFAYTYADSSIKHTRARSALDVIYDTPVIDSGPLSLGLSELPAEPCPTFSLGEGTPAGGGATGYGLDDVVSARLLYGDGIFTRLTAFDMEVRADGTVESLTYAFAAIDTSTAEMSIVLNFPLTITGTDIISGEEFSYTYANSTPAVSPIPDPVPLELSALALTDDTLSLTVENIPNGRIFHLRQSTDLTNFQPLSSPIGFSDATPQPFAISVDPATQAKLLFKAYQGPSPAP